MRLQIVNEGLCWSTSGSSGERDLYFNSAAMAEAAAI